MPLHVREHSVWPAMGSGGGMAAIHLRELSDLGACTALAPCPPQCLLPPPAPRYSSILPGTAAAHRTCAEGPHSGVFGTDALQLCTPSLASQRRAGCRPGCRDVWSPCRRRPHGAPPAALASPARCAAAGTPTPRCTRHRDAYKPVHRLQQLATWQRCAIPRRAPGLSICSRIYSLIPPRCARARERGISAA